MRIRAFAHAAPAGRDFDDEDQQAPGRMRRVRRDRRPCRGGPGRRATPTRRPLSAHSPIAPALAQPPGRARGAAPGAPQGAPGTRPRAPRLRAPRADLVAGAAAARAPRPAPRRPRAAQDRRRPRRADPGRCCTSIAACESGGNPRAVGGGGAFRGKYQFDYGTWARSAAAAIPRPRPRPSRIAAPRCSTRAPARRPGRSAGGRSMHSLPRVDASALRAEFPVLADRAYLNAGTCGPLPHAAVRASLEHARPRRLGRAREGVRRAS